MPIEIKNVSFKYNKGTSFETNALENISLSIENGEFVGIMGHTSCGKSTLIQLIAGLLTPVLGEIYLDGKDINQKSYNRSELRKKVGIVFQYPEYQLFETTVARDISFGLKHFGLSALEVKERVQWALEMTGFNYDLVKEESPLGFSGGEKRKLAIAGVLATKPEYLILDEPIAGLDPLSRNDFLKLVTRLNQDGTTIIMVSHNADSLGEAAKRILVFEHGLLVEDGTTSDVFRDVDKMKARCLAVSQSREIAWLLQKSGFSISQNITSCNDLLAAVKVVLKGGE